MHWRQLGRRLLKDEAALIRIDNDYRESQEKAYKMLERWKQSNGSRATFRVLYNALSNEVVNRKDLAEKFCCSEQ